MSDIEMLKLCVGACLANTMLILQTMDYDLETEVETFEEIEHAIDASEALLTMLTKEVE